MLSLALTPLIGHAAPQPKPITLGIVVRLFARLFATRRVNRAAPQPGGEFCGLCSLISLKENRCADCGHVDKDIT